VRDYQLVQCDDCEFIFVGHRPTSEAISEYYSSPSQYDGWEAGIEPRRKMWERRVQILKNSGIRGALLDVGTGIGQFLAVARPLLTRAVGTEVSRSACEAAKRLYGVEIHHGEIEHISFNERFDAITLFHVVEHVGDPVQTISTCVRLLNDDGVIAIAVPNEIQGLRFKAARLLRRIAPRLITRPLFTPAIDLTVPDQEIHLNYFTPSTATRLFRTCGLQVETIQLDPYHPVTNSAAARAKGIWYAVSQAIHRLTGRVEFDAFIVIGRKAASQLNS
jgi:2-polyprenyl-3-methyl-5-hydroxy-6-metoxy-1,4-benzoquinol methylase